MVALAEQSAAMTRTEQWVLDRVLATMRRLEQHGGCIEIRLARGGEPQVMQVRREVVQSQARDK